MKHLEIETQYCKLFSEEDINKIMLGFGKMCRLNHPIELINIFELVINNSIFSVLCGNPAGQLNITKEQLNALREKLQSTDLQLIKILIDKAVDMIITDLQISDKQLIKYIDKYKVQLEKRILNAIVNDSLDSLIVVEEEDDSKEEITFAFDEERGMTDKEFRQTIDKILKLSETASKIDIINSKVHSLQDFIDILNSDCLFGEEYRLLFDTLGDIELTVLFKQVFYEELRDGLKDLSLIIVNKREAEAEWQERFIQFIENLSSNRKKRIEELLNKVDYEEIKF